ncbi:LysR family transcriptional regulator [Methylobrevis pamukkalensis]|uniref:HTH-type transcriptional activator CmpR n=1 Tax=Methylobrevis pamukkalensis TaxID=1439726 RepID=A0A1E3H3Y2_9HYPH|nr:LysR family transcriptional regulator [Methylobrevis pamukkalensis]ODN70496.1 HTH-type transcriptional activator CmpR [Methylobrevis pamukkalensis]
MDLDQLRTFDRIVRDGSFTKAAARLNVTQATVSMRMRALEEIVGRPLLERGRQIGLTEAGVAFLPFARRILATMIEGQHALRASERGQVSLACLRSLGRVLTAAPIAEFAAAHRGVELTVEEGRHRDIAEFVHDRRVDLAVMGWPNLDPLLDQIVPVAVFRERVVFCACPVLAEEIGPEPTLDRIFEIAPQFVRLFWWQLLPDAIANLAFRARTTSAVPYAAARAMIERGLAVGHLLEPLVREALDAGRLVDLAPIDMPVVTRDSALVVGKPGALERPLVAELAERLIASARAIGMQVTDGRQD